MRLRGYIDGIIGGDLVGWALDDEDPERRLTVRAELDGRALGARRAADPRNDLRTAGIGDGRSGFRFELDFELEHGEHEVLVIAEGGDAPLPLADDWMVLDRDDAPRRGVALVPAPAVSAPPPRVLVREPQPTRQAAEPRRPEPEPPSAPSEPKRPVEASSVPSGLRALVGAAGWLYPYPEEGIDAIRGAYRPRFSAVDEAVTAVEEVHAAAREAGAAVVVASLPDKMHVYPEYLPPGLEVRPENRLARLVEARLHDSDTASLLDLLGVLRDARAHGRVFSRTGAGLTWSGALHAYRAIAGFLVPQLPGLAPLTLADFDVGPLEPVADSLERMPKVAWLDGRLVEVDGRGTHPADVELAPAGEVAGRARDVSGRVKRGQIFHGPGGSRIATLLAAHLPGAHIVEAARVTAGIVPRERPGLIVWLMS